MSRLTIWVSIRLHQPSRRGTVTLTISACPATVALSSATAAPRPLTAGRAVRPATVLALVPAAPASSPMSSPPPSPRLSPPPTRLPLHRPPDPPRHHPRPPLRPSDPSPRPAVAEVASRVWGRRSEYVSTCPMTLPLSFFLPLLCSIMKRCNVRARVSRADGAF